MLTRTDQLVVLLNVPIGFCTCVMMQNEMAKLVRAVKDRSFRCLFLVQENVGPIASPKRISIYVSLRSLRQGKNTNTLRFEQLKNITNGFLT